MTKLAYFQCFTGIAGDMCLGALVDAGVPLNYLQEHLNRLGIGHEFTLEAQSVRRQGQHATKVLVQLQQETGSDQTAPPELRPKDSASEEISAASRLPSSPAPHGNPPTLGHHHRHLPQIEQLILQAQLPHKVETWSLDIFRRLAIAEGAVHGVAPDQVHFHEVGATDAIVDIVGTCLGLDWLGIEQVYCSPLPTGGGSVKTAHGQLPVPVPAVLKLWAQHQVPIYDNGIERELVTPTGAAIAVTLAQHFGPPPAMTLQQVGLGAGAQELALPNMLRLWVGDSLEPLAGMQGQSEMIAVLETQIDDLSPQAIGYAFDALFAAGAVDVFTQAIGMKKSRPGILLTVICPPAAVAACESVIFQETSTLGIRRLLQHRTALHRRIQLVDTPYGPIRIKIAGSTAILNVHPEYEDCARIARQYQRPWQDVYQTALYCWNQQQEQTQ